MRTKLFVASGVFMAFALGMVVPGLTSRAFNQPDETVTSLSAPPVTTVPVARGRTAAVRPAALAVSTASSQEAVKPARKRTIQKEALIIGGSAGAGAAIGAVSGGKKGAAIGAISGGVAGLIYDMATRNK